MAALGIHRRRAGRLVEATVPHSRSSSGKFGYVIGGSSTRS